MIKASLFAIIATPNSCTIDKQLNDTSCFPISTIETFYYRQNKNIYYKYRRVCNELPDPFLLFYTFIMEETEIRRVSPVWAMM